jgi:hypothetical protein
MRVLASIAALLVAVGLFVLWSLVEIARIGSCGPAEGNDTCSPGTAQWLLLAGAIAAAIAGVLLLVRSRRRG